jgi:hypothetical protein
MDVQRAAVLLDLALAGVHAELGEQALGVAGWDARQMPPQVVIAADAPKPVPVAVKMEPVVEEAAGEVWIDGATGGVVLVVQGGRNVETDGLIGAMMAAAGCEGLPLAWVGAMGKVGGPELVEKIKAQQPQRVLVLGQGALGLLTGKNTGVEGWQAAGGPELTGLEGMAVGVTYPPEMLLRQPLFKRLAWQHLLAWQQRFEA